MFGKTERDKEVLDYWIFQSLKFVHALYKRIYILKVKLLLIQCLQYDVAYNFTLSLQSEHLSVVETTGGIQIRTIWLFFFKSEQLNWWTLDILDSLCFTYANIVRYNPHLKLVLRAVISTDLFVLMRRQLLSLLFDIRYWLIITMIW